MSKIYSPDSAGKDRTRLSKTIVLALRELMKQTEPDEVTRDITAYLIVSLEEIAGNIDASVSAWEKRGYWVKADRFRLEWEWASVIASELRTALAGEDWGTIARLAVKIAQKLNNVVVPARHRMGTPWVGVARLLK